MSEAELMEWVKGVIQGVTIEKEGLFYCNSSDVLVYRTTSDEVLYEPVTDGFGLYRALDTEKVVGFQLMGVSRLKGDANVSQG